MTETLQQSWARPRHPTIAALTTGLADVLLPPDRVGSPSSWWGHVPFAHWLVHELEPRRVVELGTRHGVSFAAFCNAVRRNGLATLCYAVDTWQGDESVFDDVSAFVQQNYASFATLLRTSSSSALSLFADGSIDLLHIAGPHSDEAAQAEFETWLPKLSERGVVLLHDTALHEPGSGAWRFWHEIRQQHPSFEFQHSHGLGVLAPGADVPDFVAMLANLPPAVAATLRQRLAELGERWIAVDDRARTARGFDRLSHGLHLAQTENARLQHEIARQGDAAEASRASLKAAHQALDDTHQAVVALLEDTGSQRAQLSSLTHDNAALRQQLDAMTHRAYKLRLQLDDVRNSTSWRLTKPYRVVGRHLKRRVLTPLLQPQLMRDFRRISRAKALNAAFYLGRESRPGEQDDVVMDYLAASQHGRPRGRQHPGPPQRRPMLGFHPLCYAAQCQAYDEATGEDPLAHYLRTGMPDGPWKHRVIEAHQPGCPHIAGLRIILHAHFHYPDLLEELLQRLKGNASPATLFITTTSEPKASEIKDILKARNKAATVVVVPNRGRDIGPLLMHFSEFEGYDIVGHVHGKRSPHQVGAMGDNWRDFLWDHLVGNDVPTMDRIAAAFAADDRLGLIFPEDPNLNHWDLNRTVADSLADRLALQHPLPPHFEFPKGTMFWARPAALRPLVDLGWEWEDFPAEPVAPDGTLLHALERLVLFSAEHAGFGYETVHVPGSWRMPEE